MASKGKRKLFNKDTFERCPEGTGESEVPATPQDLMDQGTPVNTATGGLMNTPPIQPFITFNAAQGEKVMSHNNAHLIFGLDRPSTEASGLGALGVGDTIDLVVGLAAKSRGSKGPCDGMIVNRNFVADAARIYISTLTTIDTNFGIARKTGDPEEPSSAVGMKADKVRIFGNEGVKIVTGRTQGAKGLGLLGETNSKGGSIEQAATIDLIAGNNAAGRELLIPKAILEIGKIFFPDHDPHLNYLQPAVMGENLLQALKELAAIVDSIAGVALTMNLVQQAIIGVVGTNPVMVAGGQTAALASALAACNIQGSGPAWSQQGQILAWRQHYTDPNASRYICSRNVNIT